ncbi:MAG: hypothetical protein KAI66_13635 [Lentisphaeria bacterium]|nr:hypothetical protein [Lentisphaeria bacterium]
MTHPYHPRRGHRFAVLKRRCVAGVETLILRNDPGLGTFGIPREWTDLAPPSVYDNDEGAASLLEYRCLLSLSRIVVRLNNIRLEKNVGKA